MIKDNDLVLIMLGFAYIFGFTVGILIPDPLCPECKACDDEIYSFCMDECNEQCSVNITRVLYSSVNDSGDNIYLCVCLDADDRYHAGLNVRYDNGH